MSSLRLARSLVGSAALVAALPFASTVAHAQDGALTEHPLGESAAPYGYVEYLPPGFSADPGLRRPLVVMLHGAGERGNGTTDLHNVNAHGPTKQIGQGDTFWGDQQAVIIAPQVPTGGWWDPTLLAQLVDAVVDQRHIDAYQVIVTGLSMGGGGTWDYVRTQARSRVAVALPICGASGPGDGNPFVTTATWAFHAWGDGTVPRSNSVGWVDNVADARAGVDVTGVLAGYPNADGNPSNPAATDQSATFDGAAWTWAEGVDTSGASTLRLTLYPDGSHDSWTRTYDDGDVKAWMFAHRRVDPADALGATVVVDNLDDGVAFAGAWAREADAPGFWGWDEHRATGGAGTSATYTAQVPAGRHEVFLAYAAAADRGVVPVTVTHAGGSTSVEVDQRVGGGFTSLGEYDFDGASPAVVLIDGSAVAGQVIADAIAFRPVATTTGVGGGSGAGGDGAGATTGAGGAADGVGGAGAGAPGATGGPASGTTSTGTDAGAGGGDDDAADDGGGCDCRIDGARGPGGAAGLTAAALAFGLAFARRKKR